MTALKAATLAVAVVALATLAAPAPLVRAATDQQIACTFSVHVRFSPGISARLERIRIDSPQPGTASCAGTWSGRAVGGDGLVTFAGDAIGSCPASTIDSTASLDLPLAGGGRAHIDIPLRSGRVGEAIYGTGTEPSHPASVVATGSPDAGQNCVGTPTTGITVQGRVVLGPWS